MDMLLGMNRITNQVQYPFASRKWFYQLRCRISRIKYVDRHNDDDLIKDHSHGLIRMVLRIAYSAVRKEVGPFGRLAKWMATFASVVSWRRATPASSQPAWYVAPCSRYGVLLANPPCIYTRVQHSAVLSAVYLSRLTQMGCNMPVMCVHYCTWSVYLGGLGSIWWLNPALPMNQHHYQVILQSIVVYIYIDDYR